MADLNIRLEIRLSPRILTWGLTTLLLSALATELSSENVTLTTYYPAPSGIYNQMITTQNTYLARDSGNVGIGTTSPGQKLDVTGNINSSGNVAATSNVTAGGSVSAVASVSAGTTLTAGTNLNVNGAGAGSYVKGGLLLGKTGSGQGDADAGGTGDFVSRKGSAGAGACTSGNLTPYRQGTTACPGGQYATLTVGFITKYTSMGPAPVWASGDPTKVLGEFFCCPCPSGSCPSL